MTAKEEVINTETVVINNFGIKVGYVNGGLGTKNHDGTFDSRRRPPIFSSNGL